MKRSIAILLLVICIALPLISLASGGLCPYCKKTNAIPTDYHFFYTPYNSTSHTTSISFKMLCPDCWKSFTKICEVIKDPHCNPTHYRQVIGMHIIHEYDVCGDCGAVYNSHTYYN